MSANFFICLSLIIPAGFIVAAVVNDYRSHPRRPQREGF